MLRFVNAIALKKSSKKGKAIHHMEVRGNYFYFSTTRNTQEIIFDHMRDSQRGWTCFGRLLWMVKMVSPYYPKVVRAAHFPRLPQRFVRTQPVPSFSAAKLLSTRLLVGHKYTVNIYYVTIMKS